MRTLCAQQSASSSLSISLQISSPRNVRPPLQAAPGTLSSRSSIQISRLCRSRTGPATASASVSASFGEQPPRVGPAAMRSSVTAGDVAEDAEASGAGGGGKALQAAVAAVPLLALVGGVVAAGGPQEALDVRKPRDPQHDKELQQKSPAVPARLHTAGRRVLISPISATARQAISGAVATAGPLAPLYYGVAYVLACITLLPASVLTLGAGMLFGPAKGTAVVALSATAGATASFIIARYVARPYVERFLAGQKTFRAVDSAIGRDGAKVVFLLRLSPLFPFSIGNYALGLSSVRLLDYFGATLFGILPGTFAYVNIGAVGRAASEAVTGEGGDAGTVKLLLYGVGAVATLLVTRAVSKAASAALEEEEREAEAAGAASSGGGGGGGGGRHFNSGNEEG